MRVNRYTMRQSSKCQDLCKEESESERERERLADPAQSPIDSVAMGTGVRHRRSMLVVENVCLCVCVRQEEIVTVH